MRGDLRKRDRLLTERERTYQERERFFKRLKWRILKVIVEERIGEKY